MGRKKSDSPISFPWEKLFSESDNEFDQAITYCSSEHIGSDTVKKAVTTVVSGYNSGSKAALCNKIKDKANHIRQQISKSDNVESTRKSVIDFYKNTFLKKFEGKFEGINNINIPARPILPELSAEERKIYGSPPSSPRRRPVVLDEEENIPEIDLGSLEEEPSAPSFDKILEAQAIIYASTKADKDGIVKAINAKEFYSMLTDTYQGTQAEEFMLNKDNVKRAIATLASMLKANKNKVKGVSDAKKSVGSLSLKKELRPVPPPAPVLPPSPKYEVPVSPKNVEAEIRSGAITEEEITAYIKSKGWPVPSSKSKEKLCDYVLSKIAKEDKVQDKKYEELLGKVEELTTNLFTLIDMHEERIKKLEKIKKKRKVTFAEKDEIKIIEEEKELKREKKEIEEQITEVKDKLEDATKEKEKLDTEKETKKHLCFQMKKWLDEDDFYRVEAEKDLSCGSAGICNIDKSECENSVSSTEYSATIGSASIKGDKGTVDKIKRKFEVKKKPLVIEEEPAEPTSEELKETIFNFLKEANIEETSTKYVLKYLEKKYKMSLKSRKSEIKEYINNFVSEEDKPVEEEPVVEEIPDIEEEEIPDISSDIELSEDEEPLPLLLQEEPLQKCNTIPLDADVDEETRAKDLKCGEGKVCNLEMSMCVVEDDLKEPAEEITIGGMLVKVVGSNAILNKLKEKIMKSGGEIPAEPVVEPEEEQAEEPAEDAFKSIIPGVRPSLESIIQGIKSISKSTNIVSEQSKIKAANRKCLERIAKCAGINI